MIKYEVEVYSDGTRYWYLNGELIIKKERKQLNKKVGKKHLPESPNDRKDIPIYTGVINYFPDALVELAKLSLTGGVQHGQTKDTLHWDRSKSTDHLDALCRHMIDKDWAEVAWRALANLQVQIEKDKKTI